MRLDPCDLSCGDPCNVGILIMHGGYYSREPEHTAVETEEKKEKKQKGMESLTRLASDWSSVQSSLLGRTFKRRVEWPLLGHG